jgi:hypothetical protein
MPYRNKGKVVNSPTSEYDFFTGGGTATVIVDDNPKETSKTADLTIYFNLALEHVVTIKKQLATLPVQQQTSFWVEHLWKAHALSKNSEGYVATERDGQIIELLFAKLDALRNYHSHIWHDNDVLDFTPELKKFVLQKYEEARMGLYKEFPGAVTDYENLLQKEKYAKHAALFKAIKQGSQQKNYITEEGRLFFLSFFLTTGQMNQLLQQRKGSKRTDLPEFKIKRQLYTYYSNRDGAAIASYNHEDRFIDSFDASEKQNILKARTAFKLITYLVDYPEYWGSNEAMPLLDVNSTPVKTVEQLKQLIEERALLPGLHFTLLIKRKIKPNADDDGTTERTIKEHEDQYRNGTIAFTYDGTPGYVFNINFESLHRLVVLQIIKTDEFDPLANLTVELKKQVDNRKQLYGILTTPNKIRTEAQELYLLEKENQYLRGGRMLAEKGISYFENLGKGANEKADDAVLLANYLRSTEMPFKPVYKKVKGFTTEFPPEPIQIYRQDFVLGTKHKFRAGNRFVFYMARFLMDFAGDQWYWGMENFPNPNEGQKTIIKTKQYFKSGEIPEDGDYRLTLEDNHVYLALPKNFTSGNNHERFHQFAVGPAAMRYLACYIKDHEKTYADDLYKFLQTLAADLENLQRVGHFDEKDGYALLEAPFIAGYLKPNVDDNYDKVITTVKSRIAHIKQEWASALDNRPYLSRAAKNRLVMNAYRLFDWNIEGRSDGKFLRKDEYNQLSICHYSLNLKNNPKSNNKQISLEHIYFKLFKLSERQPPIPVKIKKLIFAASSLDNLLELVRKEVDDVLNTFVNKLNAPRAQLKKELPTICRLIGVSVPIDVLKEAEKSKLRNAHLKTVQVAPYAVHPMLILKYFFKDKYNKGKTLTPILDKDGRITPFRPVIGVFRDVRENKHLRALLHDEFYDSKTAQQLYPEAGQKKQREILTGLMNTTCTEDILLWWMAQRYLKGNTYTQKIGEMVWNSTVNNTARLFEEPGKTKDKPKKVKINISDLNTFEITLELKQSTATDEANNQRLDPINRSLFTTVLIHQLDDVMFASDQSRLRKAAVHFIKRCTDEQVFWEAELINLKKQQLKVDELPKGSKTDPIPFALLRNEMDLVRRTGHKLAVYILNFEKKILQEKLENDLKNDKEKTQQWLKAEFEKIRAQKSGQGKDTVGWKAYCNFEQILTMGGFVNEGAPDILSAYRNICFHNDIPIGPEGSFAWLTKPGSAMGEILNIADKLHTQKDHSAYLPGGEKFKLNNSSD